MLEIVVNTKMDKNKDANRPGMWGIVSGFYLARSKFNSFYERHKQGADISFKEFYTFVDEDMAPLKESAHDLLRPDDSVDALMDKQKGKIQAIEEKDLFDIVLGELFHESNDLMAAVHQANEYKPRLLHHRQTKLDEIESATLNLMIKYVEAAQSRIPRKYKEVKELFDDATKILEEHILPIYNGDMTLLKSMVLNPDVFNENGVNRLPAIFGHMYKDGEFEAYYKAGMGWVMSGHTNDAAKSFNKSLDFYERRLGDLGFVKRNKPRLLLIGGLEQLKEYPQLNERVTHLTNPSA